MPPPPSLTPDTERVHRIRNRFELAARGRYTMPIVIALGVVGMVVNESAYQHSGATLDNDIALTDARVKSAETLQRLTEVGLYARSYILTASPEEAIRYRAAVEELQAVKDSAFALLTREVPEETVSVEPIERLIDEHIRTTFALNEAITLGIVEPLYIPSLTRRHLNYSGFLL